MSLPEILNKLFAHIDGNHNKYIETLAEAVSIKSISAHPKHRDECQRMIDWTQYKLETLGIVCEQVNIGMQSLPDNSTLKLPNVLLGVTKNFDPKKKTVVVYGHLDVQPAEYSDGWETEPFKLTLRDGKLYGRGASDDKGPIIAWMNAIEAYHNIGTELPINLKFVLEAMEESGSLGLNKMLISRKDWFDDVDYICITDTAWLGNEQPCISHGLRGLSYFRIEVECASKDLHSGVFGGVIHEALTDLIHLMSQLVDCNGKILIPGIYDDVEPITPNENEIYEKITFDVDAFHKSLGTPGKLLYDTKIALLQHRWRFPCLSLHGIEGAFHESGQKTVIPKKVIGKFSIRTVPNQSTEKIEKLVVDYINQKFKEWGSPNKMKCFMSHGAKPFNENPFHENYLAATKAIKHVYNLEPDIIRGGSTVPVTLYFQEVSGRNVLLLPLGCSDDGAHSQNEKINLRNFFDGSKVLASYIYEVSQIE
ncbi:hypothetical protein PVAND_007722 [Polypedilum vanderplanki]|uniref:Peptidase M20 dimerisation domain-containing protein n=1 Tax=Polypedilum vanderplanki TaxID=319348 RepID=A0A9J6C7U5_POLVA|nr:hypothetical protein PVAND_007722 [Polypedilum vanderplanki]